MNVILKTSLLLLVCVSSAGQAGALTNKYAATIAALEKYPNLKEEFENTMQTDLAQPSDIFEFVFLKGEQTTTGPQTHKIGLCSQRVLAIFEAKIKQQKRTERNRKKRRQKKLSKQKKQKQLLSGQIIHYACKRMDSLKR